MTAVQTEQVTFTEGMRVRVADPAYTEDGGYVMPNFYGQVGTITGVHTEDGWYVQHPEREHLTNTIGARYLTPVTEDEVTESAEPAGEAQEENTPPVPITVGMRVTIREDAHDIYAIPVRTYVRGQRGEVMRTTHYNGAEVYRVRYPAEYGGTADEWFPREALTLPTESELLREQVATLTRERDEARAAHTTAVSDLATFKSRVQEIGLRYAEDNDLCGVFDKCMEEIGLEGREREFSIRVHVESDVNVSVMATSRSNAEDEVTADLILSALSDRVRYGYGSAFDWEIDSDEY